MNIIYIHGLDSDANSTKGRLLENYCRQHHSDIKVLRPDLNQKPEQVFEHILSLIDRLNYEDIKGEQSNTSRTVLVGSSLGGYFSSIVSNRTGCPVLLLNPSTQPHITLQRFTKDAGLHNGSTDKSAASQIIHSTAGGWNITNADLTWFAEHPLSAIHYPGKVAVLIKEGDELLDAELSKGFYQSQNAKVVVQAGGDHRFSDFEDQLPMVIKMLEQLL